MSRGTPKSFTLLEMVLAAAIFATLMFTASMGMMSIQQTWRKIHTHGDKLKSLLKIDRVVDNSLRNIIPFTWPEKKTKDEKPVFIGGQDNMTFAALHRVTENNFNGIRFIRLYLQNGSLIAEYRNTPLIESDKNDDGVRRESIAEDVQKLSFLYASPTGTETVDWIDDWIEDDKDNKLPMAVQMTVKWKDGDEYSWLRRTAGSGKRESLGLRKKSDSVGAGGGIGE